MTSQPCRPTRTPGPLVVVEWEDECPACHHTVYCMTDGARAVVSTGGYGAGEVFREDEAAVIIRCGAPLGRYPDDNPCGELVRVPLSQDFWRAATDQDRHRLEFVSEPVNLVE